jgi:glycosyltransferase involved in cell wall biosynthesis
VILGGFFTGLPHVVHVREIYAGAGGLAGGVLWPLQRRRLGRADALLCISRAVAEQFGDRANAQVLYDGLPREPRRVERGSADRFTVALVGRISDWKGQDVLARALAEPELAEIGAIGLVAGDPYPGNEASERALRRLASELGLGDRLRLLGFRNDVDTVLGAADAVAVPSTRPEPLGLVALEAAAAGLPVVASDHGGVAEVVRDGETGLLVAPSDHRALAAALRRLADDPALARRLGEAGSRDVRERFSRGRMLAEVQAVYDRLLGD